MSCSAPVYCMAMSLWTHRQLCITAGFSSGGRIRDSSYLLVQHLLYSTKDTGARKSRDVVSAPSELQEYGGK